MHSQPDHENLPADLNMLHQEGVTPYTRTEGVVEEASTTAEAIAGDGIGGVVHKEVQRYPVASVSFHRVETPFIIGMWIFCASLAKIGTCLICFNIYYNTVFMETTIAYDYRAINY